MNRPATTLSRGADEPRWGIGDAIGGWFLAVIAAGLIGSLIAQAAGYGQGEEKPLEDLPMTLIAAQYPPLWLGFMGVPAWAAWTKGRGLVEDFRFRIATFDLVGVPLGIVAQLVMVPLVSLPFIWLAGSDTDALSEPARELADKAQAGSTIGVVLFALVVVVGAPVAEELFFRGLVLRAVEKRFGTVIGLIGSSVAFGITHLQLLQFPALTVAGLLFGWLAIRYDRLGPAILCHMAFNATTVVTLLWFT
jgi:membrane protease YdiL (CAAX protease family)